MCFSITKERQSEPEIIIAPRIVAAPRPLSIQQIPQPLSRPRSRLSQTAPEVPSTLIPLECQTPRRSGTHLSPSPRASQTLYHHSPPHPPAPSSPRASQGQIIVISQTHRSSRNSVSQLSVRETLGQGYSYSYSARPVIMERSTSGGVPIVTERTVSNGVMMERTVSGGRPGLSVQNVQGHRRSGSLGVERRGSTTAKYGGDPRASNASWRSTRERIVIVDGNGTRREYYR